MAVWTVGKHSYNLVFDMASWMDLERTVCTLDKVDEVLTGPERITGALDIACVLAKEGNALGDGELIDKEWVLKHWVPKNCTRLFAAIQTAMSEGMRMEAADGEDQVVDEILMEIEKKEEPDA